MSFIGSPSVCGRTRDRGGNHRHGTVTDGLGDSIDHDRYMKVKKTVNKAMVDDKEIALRLEYLVVNNNVKPSVKKEKDPEKFVLPGCANKYHLIGRDRLGGEHRSLRPLKILQDLLIPGFPRGGNDGEFFIRGAEPAHNATRGILGLGVPSVTSLSARAVR